MLQLLPLHLVNLAEVPREVSHKPQFLLLVVKNLIQIAVYLC